MRLPCWETDAIAGDRVDLGRGNLSTSLRVKFSLSEAIRKLNNEIGLLVVGGDSAVAFSLLIRFQSLLAARFVNEGIDQFLTLEVPGPKAVP